ncbi:MAG: MurR/RpiR family transcriptional regulator [Coriobacteriaceae bacterium]|jgi:DNA-binding MurR/RpiR family transcriptional regulator|nr:MAG: MurR/RpiR family transcriptional regulator [Coriobacteriaceae bacterium]
MINVRRMIQEQFRSLSDANKAIAMVILSNFDNISDFSVSQVAKTASVSPAMVIKFSKKFGFSGFDELKYAAKYYSISSNSYVETISNAIFIAWCKNQEHVKPIAQQIHDASRVFIMAQANSANIAYDLSFRLSKIRTNVFLAREREQQRQAVISAEPGDVLLLVSNSGNCREIYDAFRELDPAKKLFEQSILVTNNDKGRLLPYCHLKLIGELADTEEYSQHLPFANKYSLMFMLDMIFFTIFDTYHEESMDMLNRWRLQIR